MQQFKGHYVSGAGDEKWLALLEKSYKMLHPSAEIPCFQILYNPKYDTLSEGFCWGGWWIQNSLGFCLGANTLLRGEWREILQNSYDLFWDRMGDGKRIGGDTPDMPAKHSLYGLVAPDGSLGDTVLFDGGIIYKQGDGDWSKYDWFYEATAAGLITQAEDLLVERDADKMRRYLPKMRRSMEFIEKKRAENGLFLVGPNCNLLAPSWGAGFDEKENKLIPAYLTGLTVTYGEALRLMAEIGKFLGDDELYQLCLARYNRNRESLALLFTPDGYLCKSLDTDGTMHGVYGAEKYGYFESVCNVDAIAYGSADRDALESIYKGLASVDGIRRWGAICTNYPHLDDTMNSYLNHTNAPNSCGFKSGDWVDGGCWCTVEGRAILAYMKLGKWDDAFKAADWYMKWDEDWRMDEPLSQWGENTCNPWADETRGYDQTTKPIAVMVDNFAAVTCLLRGLMGITADAEGFIVKPQIPDSICELSISEPYFLGGKKVFVSYSADGGREVCCVGGTPVTADENGYFRLSGELLDRAADENGNVFVTFGNAEKAVPTAESALDAYESDVALMADAAEKRPTLPYPEANFRPFFPAKKKAVEAMLNETLGALRQRG